jgi:hypothetical protein
MTYAYLQALPADMARDTPLAERFMETLRRELQWFASCDGYTVAVDADPTVTQMYRHTDYQWNEEDQQWVDQGWPTKSLDDPDTNQVLVRLEVPAVKS